MWVPFFFCQKWWTLHCYHYKGRKKVVSNSKCVEERLKGPSREVSVFECCRCMKKRLDNPYAGGI